MTEQTEQPDFHAAFDEAVSAHRENRLDDARRQLEALLPRAPDRAAIQHRLGMIAMEQGQWVRAVAHINDALREAPDDVDAWINLGTVLRVQGQLKRAADAYGKALELDGERALAFEGLAQCTMAAGQQEKAVTLFRRALALDEQLPASWSGLGLVLSRQGHDRPAAYAYERAVALKPDDPNLRYQYAESLRLSHRLRQAIENYPRKGLTPEGLVKSLLGEARARYADNQPEAALKTLQLAREQGVEGLAAQLSLQEAHIRNAMGDATAAVTLLREVLRHDSENAFAWGMIVRIDPDVISDRDVAAMEELASRAPEESRVQLRFALAKVYERRGDQRREVNNLHEGNALRARTAPFDIQVWRRASMAFRQAATGLLEKGLQPLEAKHPDERPVFIAGMPRSGTTLLEQIIGAHSTMRTLGESSLINQMDIQIAEAGEGSELDLLRDFGEPEAYRFRELLYDWLHERLESPFRFTEKSMLVSPALGLLALVMGHARFVHIERHPMDVCWGCYRQLFNTGQQFSYTLEGCADMYVAHREEMAAWRELFPDRILHLTYEELVRDTESQVRRLLDFCGLEWEDGVLDFAGNRNTVITASANQVRKGLYSSAVGRWKSYGELMDPLRHALESRGVEIPD